ncbi:MAG: NTP transferase domain-containing protein [Alphaproteobacteria bacterium]|nr:NTP transferase domain-containing protein [Alphaproteobacteria bacterium]
MKILAVIQARMSSTRLPGKMLRPIVGRPLLWHVVHRLRKSALISEICVATTAEAGDDPLAEYAASLGVDVVRGDRDDVLGRFLLAADRHDPDVLVRVCGDSPMIEGALIDHLLKAMIEKGGDFVGLKPGVHTIHEGVDPFSRRALEILRCHARRDPIAREHVTAYFKQHPNKVRFVEADLPPGYEYCGARVSIDCPPDADFIEAVYDRLQAKPGEASLVELVALLRRDPSLLRINAQIRQKTASDMSGTFLIRCDGGPLRGFGHVKRCLTLARRLRDHHGFGVSFAMAEEALSMALVEKAGFAVIPWPKGMAEDVWLPELIATQQPLGVVFDVRTALSREAVERIRAGGALAIVLDDAHARRIAADLAFYPPLASPLDWTGSAAQVMTGPEWTLLGFDGRPTKRPASGRSRVLVTLGGSDPWGWTLPVAAAVATARLALSLSVVIGPGMKDRENIGARLRKLLPGVTIYDAPASMTEIFANTDLAVSAFGVSAQELAYLGTPAIYLCPTADHAQQAEVFAHAGCGVSLGHVEEPPAADLVRALEAMLSNPRTLQTMSEAGMRFIDGRGAERVADAIVGKLRSRRESQARSA